jgi:hypothetical protein
MVTITISDEVEMPKRSSPDHQRRACEVGGTRHPGAGFRRWSALVLCVALGLAWNPAVAEGSPSTRPLTGLWAVRIVQPSTGCDWLGEVRLKEQGGVLGGQGSATPSKDSRDPRRCPPLKGAVDGTVQGTTVRFGFATGRLGRAEFSGRVVRGGAEMQGSWSARAAAGQWAAAR